MRNKRIISVLLALLMFIMACTSTQFVFAEELEVIAPSFAESNQLYAQGIDGSVSAQAWQKWSSYSGSVNAESGVRYFFLPSSASDNKLEIYNSYGSAVTVNGVEIPANSARTIAYSNKAKYNATCGGKQYTYAVYKSDSDASVYVNDTKGYYEDADGEAYEDFYEFLTANKENAVNGSDISIVADGSVTETTLKKIKGRGNTTWKYSDKKPFTLTFNSSVSIAGLESKKFSMLSNSKDGSLLRNKIVYDLADAVDQPYSPDTRYIDFYINGVYRGSYLISKKVEMGKSSLVSLKDTSDNGVTEDFNFLLEIDIWNYQSDTHFTSSKGQEIVLNTPDLKDYDETDPVQKAQMDFIQGKYTEFESALYDGNMSELEAICDIESLAKTYLVNEYSKNCDGGLTSTYYTYNASEGKFYAAPVWDFDSGLGNVDCYRAGASKSTSAVDGWLTKTITNNNASKGKVNTLGQAFKLSGKTSDGKTYEDIVKEVWTEKFYPAISYLLGESSTQIGRLKTIDEYTASISNSAYINYIMWNFEWAPLDLSFPNTFSGQINYLKDWAEKRFSWMSDRLYTAGTDPIETKRVYFANTLDWDMVYCYSWSATDMTYVEWPGKESSMLGVTDNDADVYYCDIPASHQYIVWNDGINKYQTVDIILEDGKDYYVPNTTVSSKAVTVDEKKWSIAEPTTPTEPETQPDTSSQSNVRYYLAGLGFGGWNSRDYMMTTNSDGTAVLDFTFLKDVYYHFKVVEYTDDTITNYYQQDDNDDVTNKYITLTGVHANSDFTPDEDTRLIITLDINRGLFTVKPYETQTQPEKLLGDINGDGIISIIDATCLQKYLVELETGYIDLSVADVNKDDEINIKDVTEIQKIIAEIKVN